METYTADDVEQWTQIVGSMYHNAVADQDISTVAEAGANLSSGAGLVNTLPAAIAKLLLNAIETGYGQALRDVRDGRHHDAGLGVLGTA